MQAVEKKPSEHQAAATSLTPTQRQHVTDLKTLSLLLDTTSFGFYHYCMSCCDYDLFLVS